jgi:hypothetical protein
MCGHHYDPPETEVDLREVQLDTHHVVEEDDPDERLREEALSTHARSEDPRALFRSPQPRTPQ